MSTVPEWYRLPDPAVGARRPVYGLVEAGDGWFEVVSRHDRGGVGRVVAGGLGVGQGMRVVDALRGTPPHTPDPPAGRGSAGWGADAERLAAELTGDDAWTAAQRPWWRSRA